ncbi:MAG: hypothetical protein WKF61_05565 [Luteimonas sp.]
MRIPQFSKHISRNAGLLLAVLLLGACGEKPAPTTPPAADSVASKPGEALKVVNFSPNTTPAGTPFNVQRDGNSGISFQLSSSPVGAVKLWFDGKPMADGVVVNLIVTSTIPVQYMASAGDYPIELEVGGVRIPAGTFVVEAKSGAPAEPKKPQ